MYYDSAVLDALKAAEQPLRRRDLVELIAPDEHSAYAAIGNSLSTLYRAGMVSRQKVGAWFAYTRVERPPICAGYTWQGALGEYVVMAVADGYAMCRRPGCMPFVLTVKEIEQAPAQQRGARREEQDDP